MEIIVIANNKGGVTKTTTAVTMSSYLAQQGRKVLTIDLDPQGNVLKWLEMDDNMPFQYGVEELLQSKRTQIADVMIPAGHYNSRDNWWIIPADAELNDTRNFLVSKPRSLLAEKLHHIIGFDYVIIDTSPAIDTLFWQAICAAHTWILPVTTEYLAELGIGNALEYFSEARQVNAHLTELIILPSKVEEGTFETRTALTEMRKAFGAFVADNIPYCQYMRKVSRFGMTIWEKYPKSKSAVAYREFMRRW